MYAIGQAAQRSGVKIETIRYYERTGIVPKPDRSNSGRRVYTLNEIAKLRFVKRCRDLGFSISDIKILLAVPVDNNSTCAEAKIVGERHLVEIRDKINHLVALEKALSQLVSNCKVGSVDCAMLEALFSDADRK
jgi:MerR family transcriptional regulator, mercuric resistance operon regulatory protein